MCRQAWRSGVAVGRWRTIRRTDTTTCVPSLSSRSRNHDTWVNAWSSGRVPFPDQIIGRRPGGPGGCERMARSEVLNPG